MKDTIHPHLAFDLISNRLDWQLKLEAAQVVEHRVLSQEYVKFESGVSLENCFATSAILEPARQRAKFPAIGYPHLLRVTNKPVIQFKLPRTDHVLELAREDIYEGKAIHTKNSAPSFSKWTASFSYSKWANDLAEFSYMAHGEKPSWESSLANFFPDDNGDGQASDRRAGAENFLKEVDNIKNILWEACGASNAIPPRIGDLKAQVVDLL